MPTALIADDEPLLAQALRAELGRQWPALQVLAIAGDGLSAAQQALSLRPDVLFLDIRMPGQDGLAAAAQIADDWPADAGPLPLLVFVTAFEQHAVAAFEAMALDYVLKPVDGERLQKTVQRLQVVLDARSKLAESTEPEPEPAAAEPAGPASAEPAPNGLAATPAFNVPDLDVRQWQALLQAASAALPPGAGAWAVPGAGSAHSGVMGAAGVMGATAATGSGAGGGVSANVGAPLRFIQAAGVGNQQLHMVPVAEVLYFEAADKYVRVIAAGGEYLIRTPLRQLMQQLPPDLFWQVQRGVLVRAEAIASVHREDSGKMWLRLRERPEDERLPVGRLYAHLFKAM